MTVEGGLACRHFREVAAEVLLATQRRVAERSIDALDRALRP